MTQNVLEYVVRLYSWPADTYSVTDRTQIGAKSGSTYT